MGRKILIEVTPEEYEKIKNGCLDLSSYKTEELIKEIEKRYPQISSKLTETPWTGGKTLIKYIRDLCGPNDTFELKIERAERIHG